MTFFAGGVLQSHDRLGVGIIFPARSMADCGRVLGSVLDQFGSYGFFQIDAGLVGNQQQVDQDVGTFVCLLYTSRCV